MGGSVQVYYGNGRGKSTAALGLGIRAAGMGKKVIIVQFLKKKHSHTLDFLHRLEPELQIFRFEKAAANYSMLSDEEKEEQKENVRVGLNYARKVLDTDQCDLLILENVFGLLDFDLVTIEELLELVNRKDDYMDLILTGRKLPNEIRAIADNIYSVVRERESDRLILEDTRKEG